MAPSPVNVAVVAPGTNTSTSETTGIIALQPTPAQPFRLLDLPRDIRLIVYENLLTRRRQTITHDHYGMVMRATLVTPHPIPPLNLACKLLHEEAGPFIKARLERMSAPWAAPRLVIHATHPFTEILNQSFMVDEIITQIVHAKVKMSYDFVEAKARGRGLEAGVTERIINDVAPFAAEAGTYIRKSGISMVDWDTEAYKTYEKESSFHVRTVLHNSGYCPDEEIGIKAELKAKSQEIAKSARAGLLQIAILLDHPSEKTYNLEDFLRTLTLILHWYEIKTAVHTFGWHPQEASFEGFGYMRFDGEMSVKTWNEEWA